MSHVNMSHQLASSIIIKWLPMEAGLLCSTSYSGSVYFECNSPQSKTASIIMIIIIIHQFSFFGCFGAFVLCGYLLKSRTCCCWVLGVLGVLGVDVARRMLGVGGCRVGYEEYQYTSRSFLVFSFSF